jgi:hypothetical protein
MSSDEQNLRRTNNNSCFNLSILYSSRPLSNPIGGQVENFTNEPVVRNLQAGAGRVNHTHPPSYILQ